MSSLEKKQECWLRVAAFTGFSAVVIGAFGAHGLAKILKENQLLAVYETGVLYHLVHAVALLVVVQGRVHFWEKAAWCFSFGILIFSGSLYILAITEIKKLGMITPIGGTLFLLGWFFLFWGTFKKAASDIETGS